MPDMVNSCGSEWSRACRFGRQDGGISRALGQESGEFSPSSSRTCLESTSRVPGTVLGAEETAVDKETRSHFNGNDIQVGGARICQEGTYHTWLLMRCVALRDTLCPASSYVKRGSCNSYSFFTPLSITATTTTTTLIPMFPFLDTRSWPCILARACTCIGW